MLLDDLPTWAAVYGIRPWELDLLTDLEVQVLSEALRAQGGARGPR